MILWVCLVLCLLLPWPAAAEPHPVAALTQVTGEVMVRHEQTWARADAVPVELFSGDSVSTDRGRAEVHFLRDDSTLVLDVGTHLTLSENSEGTGTTLRRIEVYLGDLWFKMKHSLDRNTEIATPTAVGGLRGTEGLVHVENDEESHFRLAEGQLEIARRTAPGGPTGAERVTLNAGQELRAHRDKPFQGGPLKEPPVRPAVNVSAEKLPEPRSNWRKLTHQGDLPPRANDLPAISSQRSAQSGKGLKTPPVKISPPKKKPKGIKLRRLAQPRRIGTAPAPRRPGPAAPEGAPDGGPGPT